MVEAKRECFPALTCREIVPIATPEYPIPAARPANSWLSGAKLAQRYGMMMPEWAVCMHAYLGELFQS
jgi:dTDP-4-dehydrorhamnose reductase